MCDVYISLSPVFWYVCGMNVWPVLFHEAPYSTFCDMSVDMDADMNAGMNADMSAGVNADVNVYMNRSPVIYVASPLFN